MKQAVGHEVDGFLRYRIDLAYDGTEFAGWAKQPGLRTVQGVLLSSLELIFGTSADDFAMRVAGRTDAGVHAEAQVIHLDLTKEQLKRLGRNPDLVGRLNSLLPADIRIKRFLLAPKGFDARFSASFRRYRYRIADSASGWNPLYGRTQLWVNYELDVSRMAEAGKCFVGLHDFAAFSKARDKATAIRELKVLKVSRNKAFGNVIEVELMADAFAHNMVRSIVGALIKVGSGRAEAKDVAKALKSRSRGHGFKVVGPEGLSLIEVGYPANKDLAKQAEKARNMRSLEQE
ncbi:MAG: tRNA pseudouridine(38-40) synthase TruA [Microbacteriaceae bacterium]|nr:tRNA pseudouridine(38-40) synthase TruA [Microbacteriaceae bacterium]